MLCFLLPCNALASYLLHSQGNDMNLHLRVNYGSLKGSDDGEPYAFCSAAADTGQKVLEEGWHMWQKAVVLCTAVLISLSVRVPR